MADEGTIIKGIGGFYYIKTADGTIHECKARGKFRKDRITPMIGDNVLIEDGTLKEILPRRTVLVRPPVANIDMLVLVAAAASPDPNLFLLDKMLVTAEFHQIQPVICVNKIDISSPDSLHEIYDKAKYPVISTCAQTGEGIQILSQCLKDRITAFAGLSGVGKSTLLGMITGIGLETGTVSDKIQRGRHTTRHVELMELAGGGYVLDTPGFSSLELEDIPASELALYFPEIAQYHYACKFRGCAHITEPGCRVRQAVAENEMAQSRYENYKELYTVLKQRKDWEK